MGYSKSPAVLRKIEQRLAQLATGNIVTWQERDEIAADKWAYLIRQGFRIAKKNAHLFPMLEKAAHLYRIEVRGDTVRAVPNATDESTATTLTGRTPSSPNIQNVPYRRDGDTAARIVPDDGTAVIVNPQSLEQVISWWISKQPTTSDFVIESCEFTNAELRQLAEWAAAMEPSWFVSLTPNTRRVLISAVEGPHRIEP